MANGTHLEGAPSALRADGSLFAGILIRMIWLAALSFVAALTLGPLFAPASALGAQGNQEIRVTLDSETPEALSNEGAAAS